jgi:hypothetical protein
MAQLIKVPIKGKGNYDIEQKKLIVYIIFKQNELVQYHMERTGATRLIIVRCKYALFLRIESSESTKEPDEDLILKGPLERWVQKT